jgi:putative addiction module killer protein
MVTKVLPPRMVEVSRVPTGCSPFADWFNGLDAQAAAKVNTAQTKLGLGNWSNVKGVGGGVYERVIDFGPGYRILWKRRR